MSADPIWTPSAERIAAANLTAFIAQVNRRWNRSIGSYAELHRFSVDEPERFWLAVWDYCEVVAETRGECVLEHGDRMPGARWFPGARLNFARNLLRRDDEEPAIIGLREDGTRRVLTFAGLRRLVSRLAQAMRATGVGIGDRVAAIAPNEPETVAAMLAATSIGAIWSCCSPEFGASAALERIRQVDPKLLFVSDGYLFGGARYDIRAKIATVVAALPTVQKTVVLPVLSEHPRIDDIAHATLLGDFLHPFTAGAIPFQSLPFDHPVFILFSSGTTGTPKCIVHGAGGTLLENLKAQALQFDVKPGDRVYWWSTTGWVVWNLMIFTLGRGASIVLYDGSPFHPGVDAILRHAATERATFVRLTPKYVAELAKAQLRPNRDLDFSALRTMIVASSPFGSEGYDYIYANVKRDLHLASPAGGTDPLGSLVSGNPIGPVWAGEIQARALGFSTEVFDENGTPVIGKAGELVVSRPFPSMPIGFWNDVGAQRYRATYFGHFPNVWRHGDWAQINERGGVVIHGRSDATLNARGIRIGTAELYHQLAALPEIGACVAVAQQWDGDTRIVLFVQMTGSATFDEPFAQRIRTLIRENLSPRHVPAIILAVPEIPMTTTGKVSELAVTHAIHGRHVANRDTLANPDALAHFAPERLPALSARA
ncbi:MAG TPA: acetoacetate--CoA ligase [Casimicrobiaceae bacterium]|nr:acetoacetate--CoA ligase [Casimicrobiaceae bacterium]